LVTYTRGVDLSGSMQGAGGIGGLLARTDGNGSTFYHADGNGNVTALVNGSGTVVAKYLYDSFGNTLGMWGSLAAGNTYRYSSKEVDLRSEAYYYGYRYYQPNLQRWVNRDPIGESGGINLYGYVGNNPSRYYDPYGLSLSSWLQGAVNGWNGLFPDPSQSGSEESYWGNMANNDQQTENAIGAPSGYMVNQRQQMQNLENAVPSDIYVFVGCGKEINGKGAEALGLMGGNMMTGNTYFGGIGAAQLEPFGGGGEWTSSDGLTPIGFYDSGFGPGAYMSGGGNGVFFSTPTPVFIGIGLGWSTK